MLAPVEVCALGDLARSHLLEPQVVLIFVVICLPCRGNLSPSCDSPRMALVIAQCKLKDNRTDTDADVDHRSSHLGAMHVCAAVAVSDRE